MIYANAVTACVLSTAQAGIGNVKLAGRF